MLQGVLCPIRSRKMDRGFAISLLLVSGLLRLAGVLGASEIELWSSPSVDRSFLGDSLVTAKSHLISRSEVDTEKVTLPFDSLTSEVANQDVSYFHEVSGMEVEATSEDGGQTLPVLDRKPASPKQFLHGAALDPQSKAPVTSQPLFTTAIPDSKATSFSPPLEQLTTSLPREEGKAGATSQELNMTLKQSLSTPSKIVAMDMIATVLPDSEPSRSAEQRVELSFHPTVVAATTFVSTENRIDAEGNPAETMLTPTKKVMDKLIAKATPWTQAEHQQTQLDMRTSVAGQSPGLLEQTQSPSFKESSTVLFHQSFSEEKMTIIPRTKLMQPSSSASSPYREAVLEDEAIEFRMTGNPAHLIASQSNTLSSLLTPNTLSLESPPHSARPIDTSQLILPKHLFMPQFSSFSKSGTSDESEEHLQDGLILHHGTDHQTTTQISHARLSQTVGESSRTQDTPLHSTAQSLDIPFLADDKPQVSMLGMLQLAHPMSAHAVSSMLSKGISSTVASPSDTVSAPVGYIMQGTSKSQLSNAFSTVHGEQPSHDALVPSLSESESLDTSALTKPETHGTHDGQKRPGSLVFPPSAKHESEPSSVALASAFPLAGFSTSVVADSSHSESKQSVLPTLVPSESQRTVSGTSVPFQAQQQLLDHIASTHTSAIASGAVVTFHVEPNGSSTSATGLNVPGTTFPGHSSQKLSPDTSAYFYTNAPALPAQSLELQSIHSHASGELQMGASGLNVSSHAKFQMAGASASVIDESHLLVTSARAEPVTNETSLEQGLPISVDAKPQIAESSASSPTKSQLLVVSSQAPIEHELLDALAKLRSLPQNESHPLKTHSSTPGQHPSFEMTFLGNFKPRLSNASVFIHAESLIPEAPGSTGTATQLPSRPAFVHSGLQIQTAPDLPSTPYTADSQEKHTPQTSLPTSQSGTRGTTVQDISVPASSRRTLPSSDGPDSSISHQPKINIPLPLAHKVEEDITSLRTTPMLAMAGAQDLMQSSLGFMQHLRRPDIGSLDSFASSGILGMSSSLQYLSHLVQNAENMVCLQPMQNTTSTLGESIASGKEILVLSSAFGFSYPGPSSVIQMSPSSVVLVKPVLVFLPPEALKGHEPLPTEEEMGHDASLSFTSKAPLALVTPGSQEQLAGTDPFVPTLRHSSVANTHSPDLLDHLVISWPAFSASPKHTEVSLLRSNTSTAKQFLYSLRDHSTRTKHGLTTGHNEDFQLSASDSQRLEEDNPVSLSAELLVKHHISAAPSVMGPIQQQPKTLLPTTELLSILDKVSSQHSLTEPPASQMTTSSLRAASDPSLLSSTIMLHTEEQPYGSVIPITRISENSDKSLSASSAMNTKLPLEVERHLAPSGSAVHGSLISEYLGKTLSKVQHVPNAVSTFPTSSTGKEHKETAALNNPYAEAFLVESETPSYNMNTTFHKSSDFHRFPSKAPGADESLKTPSLSTLFLADALMQITLPGKHPEDIMNHQTHSRPSADVPSQVSTHSYSAKLVTEYNPTTVMREGRVFLASAAEQLEPMLSAVETQTVTDIGTYNQTKSTSLMSTMPGIDSGHSSTSLLATDFRLTSSSLASPPPPPPPPPYSAGSTDHQKEVHMLPLHPVHSFAPSSTLKDLTPSLVGEEALLLETLQTDSYRLQPSVAGTTEMVASSPSTSKSRLLKHRRNKNARSGDQFLVASHLQPQPASLEPDYPERPGLPGGEQDQEDEATPSFPISSVFSTALNSPAFLITTLVPRIAVDRLVLNQASHLQSLPPGISEIFLSPEAQVQPTLGSLSDTPDIKAGGDFSADAINLSRTFNTYTTEEQVPITSDSTEEGGRGGDSVADLPPWDSNSTPSDWRPHHQRVMRSDDAFADGFAVVSDDVCGSGNYTVEMTLQTVSMGKTPSLPNNFLAQIVLQDNRSHLTLSIKSCCVTPTARPAGPEAVCCLFPRSLRECAHIQMLQNSKSQTANFTIQLFRMVSHTVAYLHCELSVCVSDDIGCEQSCLSTLSKPSSRDSYQTLHNIISFGPVPKTPVEFTPGPVTGSDVTMMLPALLGLLTGIVVLSSVVLLLWFYRKHQFKMAAALEPQRMETP